MTTLATPKQTSYIQTLAATRPTHFRSLLDGFSAPNTDALTKAQASQCIATLKAAPHETVPTPDGAALATPKQVEFINALADTRPTRLADLLAETGATSLDTLPRADASRLIDALKAAPEETPEHGDQNADALVQGIYRTPDGEVFKVAPSPRSGVLVAQSFNGTSWDYRGAAHRFVTADQRLTLEEAAEYGRETGNCVACGRTITNPESLATGLGIICRGKYFG